MRDSCLLCPEGESPCFGVVCTGDGGLGHRGEANAAGNGNAMGCCLSQTTLEQELLPFIQVGSPTSCVLGPGLLPSQPLMLFRGLCAWGCATGLGFIDLAASVSL